MNEERHEFVEVHTSCPCGVSSDAFCIREDGSGYCFGSCGGKNFSKEELMNEGIVEDRPPVQYDYDFVRWRNISEHTMREYGVQAKLLRNEIQEIAFPYTADGEVLKVRKPGRVNGKLDVYWVGPTRKAGLFGQHVFDPGSKKGIIITEGEPDALAAYSMTNGKYACVSLKNGAQGANRDLVHAYDYVNSFEKIYICFDNDKPGKEAVQSVQGLFDFRKVYLMNFHRRKDALEYLENEETQGFLEVLKGAKRYAPDNIISSFSDIEKALEVDSESMLAEYPFGEVQRMTYGLHEGEVVLVKAPPGVGKTEFFRALEYHILKTTTHPVGIIHLEEDNATTIKALAGYELELPATLPDCGLSRSDILDGYRKAVQDDEGRVHIYSSFDVEDEAALVGNIRFLVSAAGCKFIFLDHISWLATGDADEDERRKLDRISQKLKLLAKELRFCLVMISHINDDGKTRGSRNIQNVANTAIVLSRDPASGSIKTEFTIDKVRLGGRAGPAGGAYFNRSTGKLQETVPIIPGVMPEEEDE